MRYLKARWNEYVRETGYRIYITDTLQNISENMARLGGGSYVKTRWRDNAFGSFGEKEDNRPVEEQIAEFAERAGITII